MITPDYIAPWLAITLFIGIMLGLAAYKYADYRKLKAEENASYIADDFVEAYPPYLRHSETPLFDQMAYDNLGHENYELLTGESR